VRRLITGVDSRGRSCVLETADVTLAVDAARPGRTRMVIHQTTESPPPPGPPGAGMFVDLGVAPGHALWQVIHFEAGCEIPMHHTDTIDFDMVLEGSVEMELDDGVHHLGPGDCVVMAGIDHIWRAGPDGFVMSVVIVGAATR
jgi:quercetin dioxygenase-like cupin family protein